MTHEAVSDIYEATLSDGVTPAWYGEVKSTATEGYQRWTRHSHAVRWGCSNPDTAP